MAVKNCLGLIRHTQDLYVDEVSRRIGEKTVILDIGSGKTTPFHKALKPGITLIGADISAEELRHNPYVHRALVCDVSRSIPLPDSSVDMVVSRSVLEHIPNVESFTREAMRLLRPGGWFIHALPARFAPFAIANSLLPESVKTRLLRAVHDDYNGICGFPAVYDRCWPTGIQNVVRAVGFELKELRCEFYSSDYYNFFLPAFLVSLVYDSFTKTVGIRNLCAQMLVIAQKPSSPSADSLPADSENHNPTGR